MYNECKKCIVSPMCNERNSIGNCDIRRFKRDLLVFNNHKKETLTPIFTKEGGYTITTEEYSTDFDKKYKHFLQTNEEYINSL